MTCTCPTRRPLHNANSKGTSCVMCGKLLPELEVGCMKAKLGIECGCFNCGKAQVRKYAPRLAA